MKELYDKFEKDFGIDAIYCTSVNDDYVMGLGKVSEVKKVEILPDGNRVSPQRGYACQEKLRFRSEVLALRCLH